MRTKLSSPSRATKALAVILRRHVRLHGQSLREVEARLGWGHGTLGNVLHGRSEVRLHHVEALARLLGMKPIDLLREAYEDTGELVVVTLPEDRLSALIREAVAAALQPPAAESGEASPEAAPPLLTAAKT